MDFLVSIQTAKLGIFTDIAAPKSPFFSLLPSILAFFYRLVAAGLSVNVKLSCYCLRIQKNVLDLCAFFMFY